jgi:ornithine cyclodeaminase/alanine dehydrogenase-like protein (mu-crystallin family)
MAPRYQDAGHVPSLPKWSDTESQGVLDHATGTPIAIVAGAEIRAIRTAAASGLATRILARDNAATHGIFGAGVLAGTHIDAIASVRDITRVIVWARYSRNGERFASEQAERAGLNVRATADPSEAGFCDIVSVVTGSPDPILHGVWLSAGAHVNLIGAHTPKTCEADTDVITRCSLYVDSRQSALSEAGDLLIPVAEGAIGDSDIVGEIGEVLEGQVPGRENDDEITLCKSLGVVAQDLFVAEFVFSAAEKHGMGYLVNLGE